MGSRLGDLYVSHFAAVYRVCRSLLWDPEEAADAAHDTFAAAVRKGLPVESDAHARSWLLRVARNRCVDLLRHRQTDRVAILNVGATLRPPFDPEATVVNRAIVGAVFARLSPREQRLLWQSAVEHRSLQEIASNLKLSYFAAAQALRRARLRAAAVAANVAAVLALLRPRRATLLLPAATRAVLVALVPAIVVSIGSPAQAQPAREGSAPSRNAVSSHVIERPPAQATSLSRILSAAAPPVPGPAAESSGGLPPLPTVTTMASAAPLRQLCISRSATSCMPSDSSVNGALRDLAAGIRTVSARAQPRSISSAVGG